MFNFFCNLAMAIYIGQFPFFSNEFYVENFISYMEVCPIFNIFNNSTNQFYSSAGLIDTNIYGVEVPQLSLVIAVVLSTICCIGVFFIIVKAIKKLFTCFLDF